MRRVLLPLLSIVAMAAPRLVTATVIDFEDTGVPLGTQIQTADGSTVSTGGFVVDSLPIHIHLHNEDGFGNNGSTNAGVHGLLHFALPDSSAFSLESFDFEYYIEDLGSIMVTATLSGGGTVMASFGTDGIANNGGSSSYETFFLPGTFGSIVEATIFSSQANIATIDGFFVDNIVVGETVPEPSTILLFGAGLVGLGLVRGIRRRA